jgi:hypothetical protein
MISTRCSQLEAELTGVACPPVLGGRQMSMAERCGLRAANRDAASEIGDEMLWSYYEIMCRLAAAALSIEARLDAERPGVAAGRERAAV